MNWPKIQAPAVGTALWGLNRSTEPKQTTGCHCDDVVIPSASWKSDTCFGLFSLLSTSHCPRFVCLCSLRTPLSLSQKVSLSWKAAFPCDGWEWLLCHPEYHIWAFNSEEINQDGGSTAKKVVGVVFQEMSCITWPFFIFFIFCCDLKRYKRYKVAVNLTHSKQQRGRQPRIQKNKASSCLLQLIVGLLSN